MNRHSFFVRILLIFAAFALCGTLTQCGDGHMAPPPLNGGGGNNGGGNNNGGDDDGGDDDGGDDDGGDIDDGKVPGFLPGYPKGLSVVPFTDQLGSSKCTGFFAVADFARNPKLSFRPLSSGAKKPTAYFSDFKDGTPYVVSNGGYFGGATSVSLLIDGGRLRAVPGAVEEGYNLSRAALGRMEDGSFEAAWVCMFSSVPYAFTSSLDNDDTKGVKAPAAVMGDGVRWQAKWAIGGGPMLVYDGKNVAAENTKKEVLTYISGRNPRTAIGFTADDKLVLLVCDGRGKNGSVGFSFVELATKMLELGCTYAVNLDGGGSSVFVGKDGKVLNLPSDTPAGAAVPVQRNVPTAVVIAETK
jgi:hypothetical protein